MSNNILVPTPVNNNKCVIYIVHNHVHKGVCSQHLRQIGDMKRIKRKEEETAMQSSNIRQTQKRNQGSVRMESVINMQKKKRRQTSQVIIS